MTVARSAASRAILHGLARDAPPPAGPSPGGTPASGNRPEANKKGDANESTTVEVRWSNNRTTPATPFPFDRIEEAFQAAARSDAGFHKAVVIPA